jgi:hypothetical protein
MKKLWIIFILLTFVFISCKKNTNIPVVNMGHNYFPIAVGNYIIYDVDSIVHDDNDDKTGKVDTFRYQLKEKITEEFINAAGEKSHRIERYKRILPDIEWQIKDVWYTTSNKARTIIVEENVRYIKLTYPVKLNNTWNGNAANTFGEQIYQYTEVDESVTIQAQSFDSVATVLIHEEEDFILKHYAVEQYARNVGRIYKQYIYLDYQEDAGVEYTEKIQSYGKE